MKNSRRNFIKKTVAGTAAFSIGSMIPGLSAKSYGSIIGANERIHVGVMGVNSRGLAVSSNFAMQEGCEVIYVSDVDTRAADKCIAALEKLRPKRPKAEPDFRRPTISAPPSRVRWTISFSRSWVIQRILTRSVSGMPATVE